MIDPNALTQKLTALRTRCAAAALVTLLAGCGGGGGGGGGSSSASITPMTGTLSAPGGVIAFNTPTGIQRFFAELFGRNAIAALPGTAAVPGATVRLIEIDSIGTKVGPDIATAMTAADGSFTLNVPAGFTPGPRFVIRASGSTNLDRLVSDFNSQDIDPSSDVTKTLVLAQLGPGGNIQNLQRFQVEEIGNRIADAVNNVDSGFTTATDLIMALTTEVKDDEELSSAIGNLTAAGSITGTVTDSAGAPLANIKIVVRDFNQWVARAEARTNASGRYSLNLAAGDYIVGALNFTAASMAASEWWTCDDVPSGPVCGAANQFDAAKVTVGAGATALDFKLEPGVRIQGTITSAATTVPLPGVQLAVRDFTNDQPVVFQYARPDGTFRVNVRPGTYTVGTRNKTILPFAGGLYNGPAAGGVAANGGGANASEATPMVLAAGSTTTVDFPLIEGGVVRGLVTDGAVPTPNLVTGISVRFYLTTAIDTTGAFVEAVRTNKIGRYRMWVRPGPYAVRTRGQIATPTVVAFSDNNTPAAVNFGAAVGHATATLHGPDNTPLAQVKVLVFDGTLNTIFQGLEASNSDGTVDIYAQPTGNYHIEYRVDNGSTTVGTAIHNNTANPTAAQLQIAPVVAFDTATASPNSLGTINLPAGGELKGVVTKGGVPAGNIFIQVRSGGVGGAFRFTNTRTSQDGSYSISVPAGTYNRVCASVPGTANACPSGTPALAGTYASANNGNPVAVTANSSTTRDIDIPNQ
jgi:hypothetical protein